MNKFLTLIFAALPLVAWADDTSSASTTLTTTNDATLFTSNSQGVSSTNPTHRIPAIACKGDTIIAICDERQSTNGGDIGSGRIDLVYKISTDNGKTWSSQGTVAEGGKDFSGNTASGFGYGDAAVCIDRSTGKILVMAAAGTTGYSSSSASASSSTANTTSAIKIAKITGTIKPGTDGKATVEWSSPTDMSSAIYGLYVYNTSSIYVTKAFFGSGRLCQSSIIRHDSGASYRVYGALTTNRGSLVVYSDDFGDTWKTLGTASDQPSQVDNSNTGDEAKVEELVNGDVLLCAKNNGGSGRIFNIFHYTDIAPSKGSSSTTPATVGSWGSPAKSDITAAKCNGEIYSVLATNKVSNHNNYGKEAYVMLMSVPADNNNRQNVSIYWKAINDRDDTNEVSDFSTTSNWTKAQVSTTTSAYSTMRQDGNGDIAFLYEEDNSSHSGTEAYNIKFKTISLSDITGNQYTADDPWEKRVVMLKAKVLKSGTTTSYYMRNKQANDGTTSVELEMIEDSKMPTTLDYSYYWVISKAPANAVNDQYYYLSSYQGDGYLGQVMATNSSTGVQQRNGAGSVEDYKYEFLIRGFTKKGTLQNGHTDSDNLAVTGYSINFLDLYDNLKYKNKYVAVSDAGNVNWYDHTTTGENLNSGGTYWSTDFELVDVTAVQNPTKETATCGTKDAPTEYGWPVTFTRHDNTHKLLTVEDYHYYATLKLPYAVALPEGVTAYKVTTKRPSSDAQNTYEVGLTELTLERNKDGQSVLPRETPVLLMMKNSDAGDDGKTAGGDVQKTVYLCPDHARPIQETAFAGTLGKRIFTTAEYDPKTNANYFLLSKKNGQVAFRYLTAQTINNNKAYYIYESESGAKPVALSFFFTDGDNSETTGFDRVLPVVTDDADAPVYDLMGRRVSQPTQKGIYIRGGKKFLVK